MTFSTRSNPRLAASPVALTSLGAVGGARGTAAGALRILVEFLTTYDKKAATDLQADLAKLDHAQAVSATAEAKRQTKLTTLRNSLAETERVIKGKLNSQLRTDLKQIEILETSRSKTNRVEAAQRRVVFDQTAASLGVSKSELALISQRVQLRNKEGRFIKQQEAADVGQLARGKQRLGVEERIGKIQAGRASLGPRLAGLAIGAVGGIVGGAILGVGFQLAEAAIAAVGEKIQDLIDPARHARDSIKELGQSVIDLAKNGNISIFEAATQSAKEMGLGADKATIALLQLFAAQKLASNGVEKYVDFATAAAHSDAQRTADIQKLIPVLIEKARLEGTLSTGGSIDTSVGQGRGKLTFLINGQDALTAATEAYNRIVEENTRLIDENARARQRLADATAYARVQQDALAAALQRQATIQINDINVRRDNLDSGPSAATEAIQGKIDALSGGGGSNRQAIKNIDEQRALILLRQRLRLLGDNINLEKFSGKFLLEAINAKINALQKEGDAQSHLNAMLDLQYTISRRIDRQAGESIADFVERRAQEQRHQLQQEADLKRQAIIADLSNQKDKVEDEVALAELAEQRKQALIASGTSAKLKALQKELAASKKADAAALAAKKKALDEEEAAIRAKTQEAIDLASVEATEITLGAVRMAKNLNDLSIIQGRKEGLLRGKATIQALIESFGIPAFIGNTFLANINKQLNAIDRKEDSFLQGIDRPGSDRRSFASGGVIELTNSRNPFGQNIKTGEGGSELGVILSNRVSQQIKKDMGGGPQQVGPFYLQGSSDPWRDKFAFKRLVQEAVQEALR